MARTTKARTAKPGQARETGRAAIAAYDKAVRALQLRRSGATLADIAQQIGYHDASGASKAIQRAMELGLREGADELRTLELDRLDRMQLGLWPKASAGDVKAVRAVLFIMQRRAKLLGLDAPTTIRHEDALDVKRVAEDLARELNLPVDEILAEAEAIVREKQRR